MSPRRLAFVLILGGILLVTNPVWLVPHEGEMEYTYERSEIHVENGTLTYSGKMSSEALKKTVSTLSAARPTTTSSLAPVLSTITSRLTTLSRPRRDHWA